MKTLSIIYAGALLMSMQACQSQTNKVIAPKEKKSSLTLQDSLNKPNYNVKVNKEFDEKGNLVRYDSTYSYSYIYKGGKAPEGGKPYPDNFFEMPSFGMFGSKDNVLTNDSLFRSLFFNDDFFKKQSELNQQFFDRLQPKMDSLRNSYFNFPMAKPKAKTI
jgi:hypothetical protein